MDPFSQQLVQIDQDVVFNVDTTTTINRAVRYANVNTIPRSVDYLMHSAIYYGLSHPEQATVQQLNFTCSSGNCTWGLSV